MLEDLDLAQRLDFDTPIRGFYHEGKLGPSPPIPYDVVYIAGIKKVCTKTLTEQKDIGLMAQKFSHKFIISRGEAGDFYILTQNKLKLMFGMCDLPPNFRTWFNKCNRKL